MRTDVHRIRRRIRAALAVLSTAPLWLATAPAAAGPLSNETLTFNPLADARVAEASPTTNFGSGTRLGTDGDAGLRIESVLRFNVSGIAGTIQSARLRLYVVGDGTVDGPAVHPAGSDWTETGVTWATRPGATGPAVADVGPAAVNTWVELDVSPLVTGNGSVSMLLEQPGTDGVQFYSRQGSNKPELVVTAAEDPIVMAAGDIACKPGATVTATTCRHGATSDLLLSEPGLTRVLPLGDNQYEDGLYSEFIGAGAYDATWGRLNAIASPVPGNHEYHTPGAAGYFDYFGAAAGPPGQGYYSFDLGSWHLIALNSEISTAVGSAQERWLRNDLATTTERCILAYGHAPRFSSGFHGGTGSLGPLWQALYAAKADVVVNGHDHDYERFALQDPSGQADVNGIREFVVGTGGASHSPFSSVEPNSEARDASTFGVLKLTLRASSYEWEFVPEAGGTFTDSGSTACHDSPPAASLRVTPASGVLPLAVTADASGSTATRAPIKTYAFDFGDGSVKVGPQPGPSATHTYTVAGTYTVAVTVTDTAGLSSTAKTDVVALPNPNLVRNSGFESDTSGWNTSGSGASATLARVSGGHTGEWAAQVANTGTAAGTCVLNDSPNWVTTSSPDTYTATIWVRAETGGATFKLRLREYAGGTLVGSAATQVTLTTAWQQVTVTYAPASPGSSTLDYNAYVSGAAPGTCFSADDAAVFLHDSPPVVSLAVSPSSGRAPLAVTADASGSTDTDASPIASYSFDFGDGSPGVGPQAEPMATHTYTTGGTYTVTATVKDTAGQSSTGTARVVVTDNLVRNSGFESDTSGWNTSGSGASATLARVSGGHTGEWAAQVANTGTAAGTCVLNDSPNWVTTSSAGTYTATIWVRAETGGATFKLRLREYAGGTLVGSAATQVTLTTAWQQVTVTYAPASPGSSTLDYNAYVSGAAAGVCFLADDAAIHLD